MTDNNDDDIGRHIEIVRKNIDIERSIDEIDMSIKKKIKYNKKELETLQTMMSQMMESYYGIVKNLDTKVFTAPAPVNDSDSD